MNDLKKHLNSYKKIEIEKKFLEGKKKRFKSAFYKETESGFSFVLPKENSVAVNFVIDEEIQIFIYTIDGIFSFETKIIKRTNSTFTCAMPKNYTKTQRRGLLRSDYISFGHLVFTNDGSIKDCGIDIMNISGSGISFCTDEDLKNCKNPYLVFNMEDKTIKAKIEIIEIRKNIREYMPNYRISAKFLSLNNSDREGIIKHCVVNQLKLRRK